MKFICCRVSNFKDRPCPEAENVLVTRRDERTVATLKEAQKSKYKTPQELNNVYTSKNSS